ncbi:MAG: hypothetical protein U0228_11080 [Myxococcaceae bacterium]
MLTAALALVLAVPDGSTLWADAIPRDVRAIVERATFFEVFRLGEEPLLSQEFDFTHRLRTKIYRAGDFDRDLLHRKSGTPLGIAHYPMLQATFGDAELRDALVSVMKDSYASTWIRCAAHCSLASGTAFMGLKEASSSCCSASPVVKPTSSTRARRCAFNSTG